MSLQKSPRCRPRIASWPSGSMKSLRPTRQPFHRRLGTGCPPTPGTTRSSASSVSSQKFKTRYATLGFSDEANLDEGNMWPTDFALKELTAVEAARIAALVKKAVS